MCDRRRASCPKLPTAGHLARDHSSSRPGRRISFDEYPQQVPLNIRRHRSDTESSDKELVAYSQSSILSAMDKFVKSVNNMSTCILVPSKLKDMDGSAKDTGNTVITVSHGKVGLNTGPPAKVPAVLKNVDFYSFFNMLNDIKREFLFGPEEEDRESESDTYRMQLGLGSGHTSAGRVARMKADDAASSCYGSGTDTEDSDSGIAPSPPLPGPGDKTVLRVAHELKGHLRGIHDLLDQLAISADFITNRYQEEIEGQGSKGEREEQFVF